MGSMNDCHQRGWWHRKNCKGFAVRQNFLTFLFTAVTFVEIIHMEHIRQERGANDYVWAMCQTENAKGPQFLEVFGTIFFFLSLGIDWAFFFGDPEPIGRA